MKYKGVLFMVITWTLFAFMSATAKHTYQYTSPEVAFFFQNFGAFLVLLPFFFRSGAKWMFSPQKGLIAARGILGGISFFCLFYSLTKIPLTDGTLLNNTAPLYVPFLAALFLGIPLRLPIVLSALIGFMGAVFILKPTGDIVRMEALPALLSGFISSLVLIMLRKLTASTPQQILFAYLSITSIAIAPIALPQIPSLPLAAFIPLICIGGLFGAGQLFFTRSFRYAEATVLAPFTYTFVVVSSLLDWYLWSHTPTISTALGIALVMLGGVLTIKFSQTEVRTERDSNP